MEYKRTYIDGYNVLRKIARLDRLLAASGDAARRGLVEFVRRRSRSLGHVTIVFDGHGETIGGARMTVVYSLARTADAWIRDALERDPRARAALVVSSDNEVRAHAAACGAALLTAQEFIAPRRGRSGDPVEEKLKTHTLSAWEIEHWRRTFEEGTGMDAPER
jgi:predicted RNA-binding protein with PIN domain